MSQDNLRETILANAAELFSQQGYAGTSLKQIATQSGCKAPSLYYFFEGGKLEILHEVVKRLFANIPVGIDKVEATDLCDFLEKFGNYFAIEVPKLLQKSEWVHMEFAQLSLEDRQLINSQDAMLYEAISAQLEKFIAAEKVETVAWMILCAYFGYGNFTFMRGFPVMGGDTQQFTHNLSAMICAWVDK